MAVVAVAEAGGLHAVERLRAAAESPAEGGTVPSPPGPTAQGAGGGSARILATGPVARKIRRNLACVTAAEEAELRPLVLSAKSFRIKSRKGTESDRKRQVYRRYTIVRSLVPSADRASVVLKVTGENVRSIFWVNTLAHNKHQPIRGCINPK